MGFSWAISTAILNPSQLIPLSIWRIYHLRKPSINPHGMFNAFKHHAMHIIFFSCSLYAQRIFDSQGFTGPTAFCTGGNKYCNIVIIECIQPGRHILLTFVISHGYHSHYYWQIRIDLRNVEYSIISNSILLSASPYVGQHQTTPSKIFSNVIADYMDVKLALAWCCL